MTAAATVLGLSILTGAMFQAHKPETPAFIVEGVEEEGGSAGGGAVAEKPIAAYLASADIARGEAQFKKCASCHTIEKGGATGIGPNLYGIVGAKHAHIGSFGYSEAMKATAEKSWDWDALSHWVANPKKYIPGNKMSFAGIGKPEDRANLIAFLNSKSDNPLPLPAVPAEAPAADAGATPDAAPADAPPTEGGATAAEAAPAADTPVKA
nr:cytochrome c family protein [Sandaracinobacteroides sayramensis]